MLFLSLRPTLFLVQSRSLSGRHVSTGFLDPVLGAMMKQVCWHSRRSKAYRGLPEARMAGATVEETAFGRQHVAGTGFAETTPYGNLECGRAKSGRRDLMGSQRVARPTLYFSNAGNASAAIFWWFLASAVVLRKASPASARASAGIRTCVGRFSGPCLATLLPRLIEIARACNHSSWFKFSSLQYPLESQASKPGAF